MPTILPIQKMSKANQLRAMEELWVELTRDEEKFESPHWHLKLLSETERAIETGKVKFMDWEQAKKSLRRQAR
jgi:hypothetical protein